MTTPEDMAKRLDEAARHYAPRDDLHTEAAEATAADIQYHLSKSAAEVTDLRAKLSAQAAVVEAFIAGHCTVSRASDGLSVLVKFDFSGHSQAFADALAALEKEEGRGGN